MDLHGRPDGARIDASFGRAGTMLCGAIAAPDTGG
jgi:hypothetical protein